MPNYFMTIPIAVVCILSAAACSEDVDGPAQDTTTSCDTCTDSTDSTSSSSDTCELPLAEVADSCGSSYEAARDAACAKADGFEFQARFGLCGDYQVVWEAGFYSEQWCIYDPDTGELVGARFSDDVPASCGAHTVEAGLVELGCSEAPEECVAI